MISAQADIKLEAAKAAKSLVVFALGLKAQDYQAFRKLCDQQYLGKPLWQNRIFNEAFCREMSGEKIRIQDILNAYTPDNPIFGNPMNGLGRPVFMEWAGFAKAVDGILRADQKSAQLFPDLAKFIKEQKISGLGREAGISLANFLSSGKAAYLSEFRRAYDSGMSSGAKDRFMDEAALAFCTYAGKDSDLAESVYAFIGRNKDRIVLQPPARDEAERLVRIAAGSLNDKDALRRFADAISKTFEAADRKDEGKLDALRKEYRAEFVDPLYRRRREMIIRSQTPIKLPERKKRFIRPG